MQAGVREFCGLARTSVFKTMPDLIATIPVVGLTGGIASGKSHAANCFSQLGIQVVDADECARVVVQPGKAALGEIVGRFGGEMLSADGSLDRARLRSVVFDAPTERRWLEALLHPLIGEEIAGGLRAATGPYAMLMSPLLLETRQADNCDRIVVVDLPEVLQIERAQRRDKVSADQIRNIMKAQMERNLRRQRADHVLTNEGSPVELEAAVASLHTELLDWAQNHRRES